MGQIEFCERQLNLSSDYCVYIRSFDILNSILRDPVSITIYLDLTKAELKEGELPHLSLYIWMEGSLSNKMEI